MSEPQLLKTYFRLLLLILLSIWIDLSGCNKNRKDPVPAHSNGQTSNNTSGDTTDTSSKPQTITLKLNGTPVDFQNGNSRLLKGSSLDLEATHPISDGNTESISLYVTNFQGSGTYILGRSAENSAVYTKANLTTSAIVQYQTDTLASTPYYGILTVTAYDSVSKVLSATFSFKANGINGTVGNITVTEGSFTAAKLK